MQTVGNKQMFRINISSPYSRLNKPKKMKAGKRASYTPKRRFTFNGLQGVVHLKIVHLKTTAVRSYNFILSVSD
jgi:hypothetical protein